MPYTVQLEKFQGPLDVLLQLIEQQKLAITEISLAAVTQQFLNYIKSLSDRDPNVLADFLTVASKLLVIKTKSLLPSLQEELADDEAATDLTFQLLQYKKFKLAAHYLKSREAQKKYMFARESSSEIPTRFYPDPSLTVERLYRAMQSLSRSLEDIAKLPRQVVTEVISIKQKIQELQEFLMQKIELKLSEALNSKSRTEVIVTFLALLELIKQRILTVEQEMLFSDITIRKRPTENTTATPQTAALS